MGLSSCGLMSKHPTHDGEKSRHAGLLTTLLRVWQTGSGGRIDRLVRPYWPYEGRAAGAEIPVAVVVVVVVVVVAVVVVAVTAASAALAGSAATFSGFWRICGLWALLRGILWMVVVIFTLAATGITFLSRSGSAMFVPILPAIFHGSFCMYE